MPLTVKVDHPDFPKDTEFDVGGILVPNGGSTKLDDEQEMSFVARFKKPVREFFENSDIVSIEGSGNLTPAKVKDMFPDEDEEVAVAPPIADEGSEN